MTLVEEIHLANHHTVEVWNQSRLIAADTTKVELYIRMRVDLTPSFFVKPEHYETVRKVFGTQIFFEHRMERAFVKNSEINITFQELLESFKKDTLPYLSGSAFPRRFAVFKHREIENNHYKYRLLLQDDFF